MRTIINCAYARGVSLDKRQAVYECRNPKAGNHFEMINDKKCAGCKERVPIDKKQAPAIYREEKNRQITFTEWASA